MGLILRKNKGMPLTSDEVDGNFQELLERIVALEETPLKGEGLSQVVEDQGEIRFIGSYGNNFGAFKLPNSTFFLKVYKGTLPGVAKTGQLAIYQDEKNFILVFYEGTAWRQVYNGEVILCK
ncbi:Putative chitin-binding domain of Chi A1-like proteins [Candidatus Bealeia paramacronuclearis]|uniref:Chitin-binding domain of Chi A1-like proteins n=1 Tax=Candidatus Bealeia paramacronuclearis TaxID=1921001 RepID=A0ABZ2C4J8_9PROT|nr:putative chitin-binding domain of Chi A1-like proteins [Candidatus Bealeia paramacronuclearis]